MTKTTISKEFVEVALNLSKVPSVRMFVFPAGRVGLSVLDGYSCLLFDKRVVLNGNDGFVFNFSKLKKIFSISKPCDIEIATEGGLLKEVTCSGKTVKKAEIDFEGCPEFLPVFSKTETEGDEFLITEDFRSKVAHIELYRCPDKSDILCGLYFDFSADKMFGTDGRRIEVVTQENFPESWKSLSHSCVHGSFASILKALPGADFLLCFDDGVVLKDVGNFRMFIPNRKAPMPPYEKVFVSKVDREDAYVTIPSLRLYEKLLPYKKALLKKHGKFSPVVEIGKTVALRSPQFGFVCDNAFNCACDITVEGSHIFTLLDEFQGTVEIKIHKEIPGRAIRFTSGDFYGLIMPPYKA